MISNKNQSGMSAILFAMIFAIILSLLAVAFATLVRNDQRQTIDQSLGYQAQLAAETAVNQARYGLRSGTIATTNEPTCQSFNVETSSNVSVPCVTWSDTSDRIVWQDVGAEPKYAKITTASSFNRLNVQWEVNASSNVYASGSFPSQVITNNMPILKLAYSRGTVGDVTIIYLIPSNGTGINDVAPSSGGFYFIDCGAASVNSCTTDVQVGPSAPPPHTLHVSITTIGKSANTVTLRVRNGWMGSFLNISGAQYVIEATAIAEDVVKRVEARVPAIPNTWGLGAAISADKACKDMKIDGTNNSSVSGATVCP